jgi:uncharacterized RDD family membrane protein YckC
MHRNGTPAPLGRRLAAICYDSLLLVGLLLLAALPVTLLNGGAIKADGSLKHFVLIVYLLLVWFLFYGWFWTHGGQTLGMSAWRIKVVMRDGSSIGWQAALIRWSSACLGLANLTCLFTRDRSGWQESLSSTHTVMSSEPEAASSRR